MNYKGMTKTHLVLTVNDLHQNDHISVDCKSDW